MPSLNDPSPAEALEQLRLFQAVSNAVNSSLILEDIFESLGDALTEFIPFESLVIAMLDDSQNSLKLRVAMHDDGELTLSTDPGESARFLGSDALMAQLLSTRAPVRLNPQDPSPLRYSLLFEPPRVSLNQNSVQAGSRASASSPSSSQDSLPLGYGAVAVALVNKGVVIGALAMQFAPDLKPQPDGKTARKPVRLATIERMATNIADPIAVAVENARLYWQTQTQASRAFLLNRLTKAIRQSLDIDQMLETAVLELGQVLGVSRCLIQYTDPEETPPNLEPHASEPGANKQNAARAHNTFIYQRPGVAAFNPQGRLDELALEQAVFAMRKPTKPSPFGGSNPILNPFIVNDTRDCPAVLLETVGDLFDRYQIASFAVFPVLIREQLVGSITLHQCGTPRPWINEDIELLDAICEHLGVALQQAELFKRLESQNAQLEQALNELQQAQMSLIQSEKMSVLGQFVAGIAHEVNTPLGVISANNALILKLLDQSQMGATGATQLTPQARQERALSLLTLNQQASERIDETIRSLRNFARLDESERKVVNIHEGIDSTLHLLQSTLKANLEDGFELIRDYDETLEPVSCYPGLLNQVFMNLIINASHALADLPQDAPKTLTIRTETDSPPHHASSDPYEADALKAGHAQPRWLKISFIDSGKGISPEHVRRIFDPGFTTKGVGVGTGMGLALCYRILEKHGGRIEVQSPPSGAASGAVFTLWLPLGA